MCKGFFLHYRGFSVCYRFCGEDGGRWCRRDSSGLVVEGAVGLKPRKEKNGVLVKKSGKTERKGGLISFFCILPVKFCLCFVG